jgi:hypothetical protein
MFVSSVPRTQPANSITRARWPRWYSCPEPRSRSSRHLRSAGHRRPLSRWRCWAWRGWVPCWLVSTARPPRCCRCRFFGSGSIGAASAVTFIVYAALTGATFLLPLVLQVVSGYTPLASGLAFVPLTVIMLALSARSGQLATRIGPRLQLSAGPVIAGAGLAMLTFAASGSSYVAYVLPAVAVFGLGFAITIAPLTATAMSFGAGAARWHRFGGQQRSGPLWRSAGSRRAASAGGHHRHRLLAPGRAGGRIQDGGADFRRVVRRRRTARRGHDHQSCPGPAPS